VIRLDGQILAAVAVVQGDCGRESLVEIAMSDDIILEIGKSSGENWWVLSPPSWPLYVKPRVKNVGS
jgi:hypothetical protein